MLLTRQRDAAASSEARFRALFDENYRAISRYFRVRGYQAADADDLVSATFEVAWRQLEKVPEGDGAVPWLFVVARNLSRNAWRKAERETAFVDTIKATMSTSEEMPIESREALAETMRALAQLGTLDRDLVLLVTWDELSPTEAGAVLGLRPGTARTRLHRARRRLANLLEADRAGGDPPNPHTQPADGQEGRTHDAG